MTPRVVAVSRSPAHGFSKTPELEIELIAGEGVAGDAHRGITTQHLYRMRQDASQPNLCQVHLLGAEKLRELEQSGFRVSAGGLGENVLTEGLDLLALPLGTLLLLGEEALVEVTGLRTPCSQIDKYQRGLQQHMWGARNDEGQRTRRAGIMSVVLRGGIVRTGDTISADLPEPPYRALRPV